MKNVACSMLGDMSHLEIQQGKEAMKTSKFQKYIEGTAMCMTILMVATKSYAQLTSNYTYFYGFWFSGVKKPESSMAEGLNYCRLVKTIHKGFCIATL